VAGTDSAGHVLDLVSPDWTHGGERTADSLLLILGKRGTGTLDTLGAVRGSGSFDLQFRTRSGGGTDIIAGNPLSARDEAILFPDGWVAVAHMAPYRVSWRTPRGSWVEGGNLPFQVIRVDQEEKCFAWERALGSNRPCQPDDLPGWPEKLPPFQQSREPILFASPNGRLVIARLQNSREEGHRYDIVDRSGDLVATLSLPMTEWIIGFGRGAVYTTAEDLLGLLTLRRYDWPL
jgi:hypothetical protein